MVIKHKCGCGRELELVSTEGRVAYTHSAICECGRGYYALCDKYDGSIKIREFGGSTEEIFYVSDDIGMSVSLNRYKDNHSVLEISVCNHYGVLSAERFEQFIVMLKQVEDKIREIEAK